MALTHILSTHNWLIRDYCPTCPEFATRLIAEENNPGVFSARTTGTIPEPGASPALRSLYASVASGELRYVEAAEPISLLARLTPPNGGMLQGVALDGTISVAKMFVSFGLGSLPIAEQREPRHGTPDLHGNEAIVLSATARRVFVLGGTSNGTPAGVPADLGWALNIDTNIWTSYPLAPASRPANVLGATFRFEDDHVCVVDTAHSKKPRIDRWKRGSDPQTIGTLPRTWAHYDRSWLVAGPSGELIFAATRSGGGEEKSMFAKFALTGKGELRFDGLTKIDEQILAAPVAGKKALTLIVPDPSGGRLLTLPLSAMSERPDDDSPEMSDPDEENGHGNSGPSHDD